MKKIKEDLYKIRFSIVPIIIYIIVMQLIFGTVCPIKAFLKVDCPGCGLTRATIALLKGDIHASLHYNYTCILWIITITLFIIDRYIKPFKFKPFPKLFALTSIITIIRYILLVLFGIPKF